MSGHSKWATIHRQKEAKDAKKGAVFTKLAAAITVAVREGGGITDPGQNFKLRLAVDMARQFNMPKENISRAIEKGTGGGGAEGLVEVVYEGFGPGGVAVVLEAVTDNKLRTWQKVREVFDKNGGTLGGSGAVGYLFAPKGELRIKNHELSDEDELKLIDLGADEIDRGDEWVVYCAKERTFEMKDKLEKLGYGVMGAELAMKPVSYVNVSDPEDRKKVENILEKLEDLDDVHKVWTNYA